MQQAATGETHRTNAEITAELINQIAGGETVHALALLLATDKDLLFIEGYNLSRPAGSSLPLDTDLPNWLVQNSAIDLPDIRPVCLPLKTHERQEGWMCMLASSNLLDGLLAKGELARLAAIQAKMLASYRRRMRGRQSIRAYRQMIDTLEKQVNHAVIWISCDTGLIENVNAQFERLAGFDAAAIIGRNLREIETLRNSGRLQEAVEQSLKESRSVAMTLHRQTLATPVSVSAGIAGCKICVTLRDCSEEIARRKRLLIAERRGTVYYIIGKLIHDVNNPLTAVFGFAQMVAARDTLPQTIKEDINRIVAESKRSRQIIGRLSAFMSAEVKERELVDINATIAESAELQGLEAQYLNVSVETELEPQLPPVYADRFELQCLVDEIMDNSLQSYRERATCGRIIVRSKRHDDSVLAEFEDEAGGAPNPDKVFEPFYAERKKPGHLGLGLSFAKAIVEGADGTIAFANTTSGAKVTCLLPAGRRGG